jgi:hypothetical protein
MKPKATAAPSAIRPLPLFLAVLAVLLLAPLVAGLVRGRPGTVARSLDTGLDHVTLAAAREDYDALRSVAARFAPTNAADTRAKADNGAVVRLREAGRLFSVPNGTPLSLAERDGSACRVTVRGGEETGRAGWLPCAQVETSRPQ